MQPIIFNLAIDEQKQGLVQEKKERKENQDKLMNYGGY